MAAGGLAPLIAVALLDAYDSFVPIALYVAAGALLTLVTVLLAGETRGRDLTTLGVAAESGSVPSGTSAGRPE